MTTRTSPATLLSERELTVLRGLAAGHTHAEIGAELYLSPATVKTHARRLYHKLGARRATDAVRIGQERGLLPPVLTQSDWLVLAWALRLAAQVMRTAAVGRTDLDELEEAIPAVERARTQLASWKPSTQT